MGIFSRIGNGWSLAMTSLTVVWRHKKLAVFPIISSICLVLVLASFAGGVWASGIAAPLFDKNSAANQKEISDVVYYAILFAFYFVAYFLIVFFNMALIHCANHAFNKAEFTLGTGIAFSFSKIGVIASWAFVSATVGLILRIIEDKNEKIASFIAGILGMAWALLTFFVVPVIAYEGLGPIAAIKRSGALFKSTWGERVGASFAFGWVGLLMVLFIALPIGILLWMVHPIAGVAAGLLCLLVIGALTSAAETVFTAAVYQYAIGRPVDAFATDRLQNAFQPK